MNYTRLKEIIEADVELKALFDKSQDEVIARILNTVGNDEITLPEARITKHDLHNLFGFARTVQILSATDTRIKVGDSTSVALAEIVWLLANPPGLNIAHRDAVNEIGALVALNIITSEEGSSLLAKAKKKVSLAEKELGRTVSYQDVARAKEIK